MSVTTEDTANVQLPGDWTTVVDKQYVDNIQEGLQGNIDQVDNKFNNYTPTINIPAIKVDDAVHADKANNLTSKTIKTKNSLNNLIVPGKYHSYYGDNNNSIQDVPDGWIDQGYNTVLVLEWGGGDRQQIVIGAKGLLCTRRNFYSGDPNSWNSWVYTTKIKLTKTTDSTSTINKYDLTTFSDNNFILYIFVGGGEQESGNVQIMHSKNFSKKYDIVFKSEMPITRLNVNIENDILSLSSKAYVYTQCYLEKF